jgi:putative endonuclease
LHAEQAVADYLFARGLTIVGTNVRVGRLEIDIIAVDGPAVAVIEVRTRGRSSWLRAFDSIDPRKQRRLRIAGERLWRDRFSRQQGLERMRFDVASVRFDERGGVFVEHVRGAF